MTGAVARVFPPDPVATPRAPRPPELLREAVRGGRSGLLGRLRRLAADRPGWRRLGRYVVTSVVATVASELTLLVLYGTGVLGAASAAVVANLAGTVPSYVMSRYWIWSDADRARPGRQAAAYWVISLVSLGVSTGTVAAAGAYAPAGHTLRLVVVGLVYVGTYGVLWLAKFAAYQWLVFPRSGSDPRSTPPTAGS